MKAIVAVDKNWAIGCEGKLLERIPEDMKFFKQTTLNKVVVMGRETFESFPGKQPLKDRINIVLSRDERFVDDRVIICRSLDDLFNEINNYSADDVFVIGGESIYRQLIQYCTEAYVTKIENAYKADKFFVNLDEDSEWNLLAVSDVKSYNGIKFTFNKYVKG